ncbi:hypothetical protein D3C86_2065090 [compost metagenome]
MRRHEYNVLILLQKPVDQCGILEVDQLPEAPPRYSADDERLDDQVSQMAEIGRDHLADLLFGACREAAGHIQQHHMAAIGPELEQHQENQVRQGTPAP